MEITETTVLLVRHAHTTAIDSWLCGRSSGVPLSSLGHAQALALAEALQSTKLAAIYSSPLERAVATATAIASAHSRGVEICQGLTEVDFGRWTGLSFAALSRDPEWHAFNTSRATAIVPEGEQPGEVQARIVHTIARLSAAHRGATVACVTHADVIRCAVLHYQRRSLDDYHQLTIDPASITTVRLSGALADVIAINAGHSTQPDPL